MHDLAALLRKETHTIHRRVESGVFMTALLKGEIEKSAYVLFLRNLEPIYEALERGLVFHADAPGISPIIVQSLFRLPSLHRDLAFLHGADWRIEVPQLDACSAYVDHLNAIQSTVPARLGAHAYVRYLGDLSGGQMLRKIVSQSLNLGDQNEGVNFYNFGEPPEVVRLVQRFRAGLNLIGEPANTELADEAVTAFELHIGLFDDLALISGLTFAESLSSPC